MGCDIMGVMNSDQPLQIGDAVQIATGERGKIVHISRMTYFVSFHRSDPDDTITGLLESDLVKIEEPEDRP